MSGQIRLKVAQAPRDPERFPLEDDEELGISLFGMLAAGLERGLPGPALLCLRDGEVQQFSLAPVLRLAPAHRERLVAAMAGQPGALCGAYVGPITVQPAQRRLALVYLEWPDNRWWLAQQPLDEGHRLVGEAPELLRAVDGAPKPQGIGGWYARCRRENLSLVLRQDQPVEPPQVVH
jgi:hypothetical protein